MLHLGETTDAVSVYKKMISKIQNPFEQLKTDNQCMNYFEEHKTYLPPIQIKVGEKKFFKIINGEKVPTTKDVTAQIILLRDALKKFFELPDIFDETMSYIQYLESQKILKTNVIQGLFWQKKKLEFGTKVVLPLFFYQDDFETNNALGSHRGLGKMGTVYINIPCLPPRIQSKIDNIFLLSLYKADDLKHVTLNAMLSSAVSELTFLESTGINISTPRGPQQIYFAFAGVIGDNLAVHSILGFTGSFNSKHPCRFCSIDRNDINSMFHESDCLIRTNESYDKDLKINNVNVTGVCGPSILHDIKSAQTIELLTVDVMHDILEEAKLFTLDTLNDRIMSLFYGADEIRNKPGKIKNTQISNKYVKMSAGCLKPKHHFLTHYSRIMRMKGPAWHMNIMRNESMNRNIEMTAVASLTRKNISKTLAIKHQLHLNYRFLLNNSPNKSLYDVGPSHKQKISSIPQVYLFLQFLSDDIKDEVLIHEHIKFKGEVIQKGVILMIPSEMNPEFYITRTSGVALVTITRSF
ncbi:uncharacterized protein LOC141526555 [Cotesia typhae]|uniref:uncharacterized protein LOC141526555 n=1 Tax=Cotesia typhae TaxID=2053667 RepID=UPI003D69906E